MMYRWFKHGMLVLLFASPAVYAGPILNGDFTAGGDDWNDVSFGGSVDFIGGAATLGPITGGSGAAGAIMQGDDGTFFFLTAITLDADVEFLQFDASKTTASDLAEGNVGPALADNLNVSLIDELDFTGNSDLNFTEFLDFTLGTAIQLDVTSLAGRSVALLFELFDEATGVDSTVTIDNVAFINKAPPPPPPPTPASEPGVLLLLLGGLGLAWRNRRAK